MSGLEIFKGKPNSPPWAKTWTLFERETRDSEKAKVLALRLHYEMSPYLKSVVRFKSRKVQGQIQVTVQHSPSRGAIASLKKLKAVSVGYAWDKAYVEMSPAAHSYLWLAADQSGRPLCERRHAFHEEFFIALDPDDVRPLIDDAIALARKNTKARPQRDEAIIAILRTYQLLRGVRPTAKPARGFIEDVARCYDGKIPNDDFAPVLKSGKSLQRLIDSI